MTTVIGWLIARGWSRNLATFSAWGGFAIMVAALTVAAWTIWLGRHDAGVIKGHETEVQLDIERAARAADGALAERQRSGEAAITIARKEFEDATHHLPHEGLTRRQRVDLCLELRDAGTDTSVIPQCADLPAGAKTGAVDRHPRQ